MEHDLGGPPHDHFAPGHDAVACIVSTIVNKGCHGSHKLVREHKQLGLLRPIFKHDERLQRAFEHLIIPFHDGQMQNLAKLVEQRIKGTFSSQLLEAARMAQDILTDFAAISAVMVAIAANPDLHVKCDEDF